jgi:excisionase family DNA binding protein
MTERLACSIAEAAALVGLSVRSLRYLMSGGKLGYARIGRRLVIPHSELERLLRRAGVKATATLDADESIRPKAKKENAPTGEVDASMSGTADTVP